MRPKNIVTCQTELKCVVQNVTRQTVLKALVQDRNPSVGIDVSEGGDGDADREGERLPEHCAAGI